MTDLTPELQAFVDNPEQVAMFLRRVRRHVKNFNRCAQKECTSDNTFARLLALLADRERKLADLQERYDDLRTAVDLRSDPAFVAQVQDARLAHAEAECQRREAKLAEAARERQRLHALVAEAVNYIDPEKHPRWYAGAVAETGTCDEQCDKLEAAEATLTAVLAELGLTEDVATGRDPIDAARSLNVSHNRTIDESVKLRATLTAVRALTGEFAALDLPNDPANAMYYADRFIEELRRVLDEGGAPR